MVSAKPLTIGLNRSNILVVWSISDWFNDFLNDSGPVQASDRLPELMVDY